jgi:hypothetical protein
MNYRITIEADRGKDERGYINWEELYKQVLPELNVKSLVTHINNTRGRKRSKQHEIHENP